MAEKLMMLALSPTMETGTIAKWNVKEGEAISNGDIICEVETDKATMDYESMTDGTLLKIVLQEGGQAKVGDTIAIVGEEGEDISSLMSSLSVSPVKKDTPAVKVSSEARTIEMSTVPATASQSVSGAKIIASPLARKLAGENGIDIRMVNGSGPGGRIVKRDVEAVMAGGSTGLSPAGTMRPSIQPTAPIAAAPGDKVIEISQKRAIIAQRLAESKYTAPHYYLKLSIRMDEMLEARQKLNREFKDGKVSVNAFLIKFAAEALKRHPAVNSTWNGEHILQHGSIDIGLAVAQADGLITPVVRNCGAKGMLQIEEELKDLIDKAQNNRLVPEEYTGATFTISNLGSYGIDEFTAIINPPGSAILAVGKTTKTPVVVDDNEIEIQSLMKVTLSCDHRIVDGVIGSAFLKDMKDMIETPIRTLF